MSERAGRGRVAALALVVLGLGAFVGARLQVTTEVTDFVALGDDARGAALARALAGSELTRALVIILRPAGAPAPDLAARAGAALEEALAGDPAVAWVRGGVAPDLERAVHALLFPRRLALLSVAPDDELPSLLSDDGLRAHARALKRQLELPSAPLVKRLLPDDPLLAFPRALERLEAAGRDGLRVHEGRLLTGDGGAAVLFVGTRASPFDTASAGPLLARLEAHRARLSEALGAPLALERGGAHPFAVAAERGIRADVARISALSTAAIVGLLLVLFRSPRAVPASAAPVVVGLLAGTSAALLVHGRVHGLTLAFGATLIGVCIDHPLHVMTHHALAPAAAGPLAAARAVWPGLRLAGLTTVVGLGGLALSGLPGLREVGLFTTTGVLAALATTRWLVPALLPPAADPTPLQRGAARACAAALDALRARPALAAAPALVAVALVAVGLPRAGWTDDLAALQPLDPALVAEEARVRAAVARVDAARLVVARGADVEAALRRGEAAAARLDRLVADGGLGGFRSLRGVVPSRAVQARALEHLADPTLPGRLAGALAAEGFRPEPFAPGLAALGAPPAPLTLDEVLASPLADLARPFVATLEGEAAVLLYLVGADLPRVQAALADLEGVDVFDQRAWLAGGQAQVRGRALRVVGAGVAAILLLVLLRHRRPLPALAAVAPALLAAGAALGLLGLLGEALHLMHLVAALLVLCLGVDYGVFLAERRGDDAALPATLLAMALSCATTLLAFGLLALSSAPVLRAVGLTVGLGVVASLVLAPAARVLARGGTDHSSGPDPRHASGGSSPRGE